VYAATREAPAHERAREWLNARLGGPARVGLPWQSILAFVRITTNPRVVERPLEVAAAWSAVETWLSAPPAWIPTETERHRGTLARLLATSGVYGNRVMDAHLAAIAIDHGLELMSADRDFARFPGVRWSNPLAA